MKFRLFILFSFAPLFLFAQTINRQALVQRHNVIVTTADTLSSLTVGNGRFAFTVDVTGLQSFPVCHCAEGAIGGLQKRHGCELSYCLQQSFTVWSTDASFLSMTSQRLNDSRLFYSTGSMKKIEK